MKNLILAMLMLVCTASYAQHLKTIVPAGSKVYVQCQGYKKQARVVNKLKQWGNWNIVDDRDKADFILKIDIDNDFWMGQKIKGEFLKNNEVVFTTRQRTGYINKFINKSIIRDKN